MAAHYTTGFGFFKTRDHYFFGSGGELRAGGDMKRGPRPHVITAFSSGLEIFADRPAGQRS